MASVSPERQRDLARAIAIELARPRRAQPQDARKEPGSMNRFRKLPVEIEAVQFSGRNQREVLAFIYPSMSEVGLRGAEAMNLPVVIETLEGDMTVSPGDWVIRGVQGEFYPCRDDIFRQTYEAVSE